MTPRSDQARYRENLQAEIDSSWLYAQLSRIEGQSPLAQVYRRMSESEGRHAAFWRGQLETLGEKSIPDRPSRRARILWFLSRVIGTSAVVPLLAADEKTASHGYDNQPDAAAGMSGEEQGHARMLTAISGGISASGGMEGSGLARLEGRHRGVGGNALRAGVLGANDGLISILNLVMGVAGAQMFLDKTAAVAATAGQDPNATSRAVIIAGFAGMLVGASSMAMGEWLSVQSSRELYARQIDIEAQEITTNPAEEQEELSLIYQAKGLPIEQAKALAQHLMADKATATATLAREELGIDPEELGGSAWTAAGVSFLLFALGAIFPMAPFLFVGSNLKLGIAISVVSSTLALFGIGAAITLLTGRSVWYSGLRQVLIGLISAAVTYGVGAVIGVSIG